MDIIKKNKGPYCFFALIGLFLLGYYIFSHYYLYTTDAYIEANVVNVKPEVTGIVEKLYIHDLQAIKKGQTLFQIDKTPYISETKKAKSALINARRDYQKLLANRNAALESIKSANADFTFQSNQLKRYKELTPGFSVSVQKEQQVLFFYQQAKSQLAIAKSMLAAINAQLGEEEERYAPITKAKAALMLANYNLQHTNYKSPVNGYVTAVRLQEGDFVQKGESVFALIDESTWWVFAKIKEDYLPYLKTNNNVRIWLPSQSGITFHGQVFGVGWGVNRLEASSDSRPWILPYLEQSEHWIQLAQRFPVKIPFETNGRKLHYGANAHILISLS